VPGIPCGISNFLLYLKNVLDKGAIMPFTVVEKNAENLIGLSADTIRKYSPDELRLHLENKNKREFSFTTEFPIIGRGNVLRDSIKTSKEINRDVDRILARSK
jgi:hypothetical protein